MISLDSYKTFSEISINGKKYGYFDHLKVGLMTEVFYDWLHTKAYN